MPRRNVERTSTFQDLLECTPSKVDSDDSTLMLTYKEVAPKKLNHPQVRRDGGRGTKSRLHQAVVSSFRDSSLSSTAASLILRSVNFAIVGGYLRVARGSKMDIKVKQTGLFRHLKPTSTAKSRQARLPVSNSRLHPHGILSRRAPLS